MSYKVIIDSCGELTEEMKKSGHFETVNVRNHHVRHRKDIWKNIIAMRNMYMQ